MRETTAIQPDESALPDNGRDPVTLLWQQRLALAICGAAVVAGAVLAGSYTARREWPYAVISLLLVGWSVLIERLPVARLPVAGSAVVARHSPSPARAKATVRLSSAMVRLVAGTANSVFAGYVLLATLTLLRNTAAFWSAVAIAAALVSWDLHHFRARLMGVTQVGAPEAIVKGHLRRLAVVVLGGLGLGLSALSVRVHYGIQTAVLLSLLVVFGLSRAIAYLRRASD